MLRRSGSAATFAARCLSLTGPALPLALLALLVTGCGKNDSAGAGRAPGPGPSALNPAAKKILNDGNGAEPQDLDFQIVTGVPEHRLALTSFEGLISEDPSSTSSPASPSAGRFPPTPSSIPSTCGPTPNGPTATPSPPTISSRATAA